MHDGVDRLREIDDDRALAPPQDVEGREIPVHKLGFEDQANLALQLSPDPSCGPQVEIDIGEPGGRSVAVADERHAVAVLDPLDGWRHRHAGVVQPLERLPFVRLPPRLKVLLTEARSLLYGSTLVPAPPRPRRLHTGNRFGRRAAAAA